MVKSPLPEFSFMNVKLKFSDEDFEMYDMTTLP